MKRTSKILVYILIAVILGYTLISILPEEGVNVLRRELNMAESLSGGNTPSSLPLHGKNGVTWSLAWLLDLAIALCVYLIARNRIP
ncbi:hypothetical protein J7L60_04570 [Candidatus Bathyarchaeota archaeon]|nr:hypothetical protein [Candidatus Bathyarchaeota archaeon]